VTAAPVDLGPQYSRDSAFTARMRLHQSWYRAHVLGAGYGVGPTATSPTRYGNMLGAPAGEAGANFLTPQIFEVAKQRIAAGGGVERFRCLHNMLSSQPMCFNVFGPLVADVELATRLMKTLLPGEVRHVVWVAIEWAPSPKNEYLGDATSFDAVVVYERPDGRRAFVGIETKLTDSFSPKEYKSERYRQLTECAESAWRQESWSLLAQSQWNQLWRNQLLVEAVRRHPKHALGANGRLALVRHPDDPMIGPVVDGYRTHLGDPDSTFVDWPLDVIVERWKAAVRSDGELAWLDELRRRYLDLAQSDTVIAGGT
jgi:hypothetical protein